MMHDPDDSLFDAPAAASFPPLFTGLALRPGADPFAKAVAQAMIGVDAGLLPYAITADRLAAAVVFAPEEPLRQAMVALIACGVGLQNAFGALAPPEVGLHLGWPGDIYLNGGRAGRLRVAAAHTDPDAVPDWLVVGLELDLLPPANIEPGARPNETCLAMEGCGDVDPQHLIEAWARHLLVWLHEVETGDPRALATMWRGLAHGLGKDIDLPDGTRGTFVGIDEDFGLLLRQGDTTRLVPLITLLENGPPR